MENDLYTYSFCRDDWELIMDALRESYLENMERARTIGTESTYGAILIDRAMCMQALADDIDFKLPEWLTQNTNNFTDYLESIS